MEADGDAKTKDPGQAWSAVVLSSSIPPPQDLHDICRVIPLQIPVLPGEIITPGNHTREGLVRNLPDRGKPATEPEMG